MNKPSGMGIYIFIHIVSILFDYIYYIYYLNYLNMSRRK